MRLCCKIGQRSHYSPAPAQTEAATSHIQTPLWGHWQHSAHSLSESRATTKIINPFRNEKYLLQECSEDMMCHVERRCRCPPTIVDDFMRTSAGDKCWCLPVIKASSLCHESRHCDAFPRHPPSSAGSMTLEQICKQCLTIFLIS